MIQDKRLIFARLSVLPPDHKFWQNKWMFTYPVFTQESRMAADADTFWQWTETQAKALLRYVFSVPGTAGVLPYVRSSGIAPGDDVSLVRGSRGRGPETGSGFERKVRAKYLGGDAVNVICALLEDDPHGGAPNNAGEIGVWHGDSFLERLTEGQIAFTGNVL